MPSNFSKNLRAFDPNNLGSLGRLGLHARQVVEGFISGLHRSNAMGWNVEFADYREYARGDDLRTLDWKVYARTDRYYIRRYEEETSMRVYLAVDTSASMGFEWEGQGKLERAAQVAAALAYLLVRQRDAVGLFSFSDELTMHLMPGESAKHLRSLWLALESLEHSGNADVRPILAKLSLHARRRGLLILLTDALCDIENLSHSLAMFVHRRFDVMLLQVLTPAELDFPFQGAWRFKDLEGRQTVETSARAVRRAYLDAMEQHNQRLRGECARMGVDHHLLRTDEPLERALAMFLHRRQRLARG